MLLLAVFSISWWKEKKSRVLFAWLSVFAIGFQAWLGATVVYSVLEPVKITLHMFMALLIVGMLLWMLHSSDTRVQNHGFDRKTYGIWWLTVPLSLVQILLGTQVRQYIDHQAESLGMASKQLWLQDPDLIFYVHRSFSILVLLLHLWVAYRIYTLQLGFKNIFASLWVLLGIIGTGIAMNYFAFPWGSQPLHLVLAAILFGLQWYALMEFIRASRTRISS